VAQFMQSILLLRNAPAVILSTIGAVLSVCPSAGAATGGADPALYNEPFRPQIHYSPPEHWMNDPNGLVQVGGRYQLYYQYHPYSLVWGPMHWGHADSEDLLHWATYPWVLGPDDHGAIFSGSAVVDIHNTAGLAPAGESSVIAIFTYHDHRIEAQHGTAVESQGLAYSLDHGKTFTKYPDVVLENRGNRNFRDPHVQWFEPTQRWIMTLVATDHVEFYSSSNLKDWNYESDFGVGTGAHGGVWECPDLLRMALEPTGDERDVLLVSTNPGGPAGGGGTQYFVGHFDGHRFIEEAGDAKAQWLDYGPDYYAAVTWSRDGHANSEPPVLLGWMNDWRYAVKVPTSPWRGVMAIPRELHLRSNRGHYQMTATPIPAVESLGFRSVEAAHVRTLIAPELLQLDPVTIPALEFNLVVSGLGREPIELRLQNQRGQSVVLRMDPMAKQMEFDRSRSGVVDFDPAFTTRNIAPFSMPEMGSITARILVDRSSVEIFLDDGATDLTALVFPNELFDRLDITGTDAVAFEAARVTALRSVWGGSADEAQPPP